MYNKAGYLLLQTLFRIVNEKESGIWECSHTQMLKLKESFLGKGMIYLQKYKNDSRLC
jgi:hypothetical protein